MFDNIRRYLPPAELSPRSSAQEILEHGEDKRHFFAVSSTHPEWVQTLIFNDDSVIRVIGAGIAAIRDRIFGETPIGRF